MGAWGVLAFDNDEACDWAFGLKDVDDLSMVEDAFSDVETSAAGYLDAGAAANALAACELLARLEGRPGYTNAYTQPVDLWVAAHPNQPTERLTGRALAVIDRILGADSELRQLWDESGDEGWQAAMADLRSRVRGE